MNAGTEDTVLCLMGPTATGKTDLAVALAERWPVEIVSVDSAMVYREMDIGTAKPGPELLARAPHRLIDLLDPSERYSAARFVADACAAIRDIRAAGRIPLLVGGTGLYFKALQEGLSELPAADPDLRRTLEARLAREGPAALHAELARVDPVSAARIRPGDPQRIQRALEVHALTGVPLSEHLRRRRPPLAARFVNLVLTADRAWLRERIAQRFARMLEAGFLAEVARLRARGDLTPDLPSMRAVGYRQAWRHLAGETDFETFRREAVQATRGYAKRQQTWFRHQVRGMEIDCRTSHLVEAAARAFDLPALRGDARRR
ncbi:MAG: tRNA (adenosine(37)-N6)-dimethylallyltransferase MiaA [Gammaproteobacteria bacterium]|nr:MAG: tRNA (adenosine(37)-N6)-dimethylallyltransferase MiaA [Gammaproteobacteria bacterium]